MEMRRHILLFFVVLGPLGLLGCSAGDAVDAAFALGKNLFDGEPDRTEIEATFRAAADLNPDYQGNPSPLVVRFYELKSPTAFNNAGFFDLYDNAEEYDRELTHNAPLRSILETIRKGTVTLNTIWPCLWQTWTE